MTALVLSDVFPPRPGGSGRWLWELYRRSSGMKLSVVAGEADGDREFDRAAPLPITRLPLNSNWGVLHWQGLRQYSRRLKEIRAVMRREHPDVLHCGKCLPEGLIALWIKFRTGEPFIVYAHGEELTLARTSRELRVLTARVLHGADAIVANSRHTQRLLTSDWQVQESRVTVVHPGVDTTRFVPVNRSDEVRRRLGWTDRSVILTVGALQKRKGQDMLIRALPSVRARCPNVLYSVVGEGWEHAYLESLTHELGVTDLVEFRGVPIDADMIECYQQCDLFALPNRQVGWDFEGFGMVSIEAQACGKAVVVGDSGGAPETVQDEVTGRVVNCDTPDGLAAAIVDLLGDSRRLEQMGAAARARAVRLFDWSVVGEQAARLFRSIPATR